jgi:hypothetical protein
VILESPTGYLLAVKRNHYESHGQLREHLELFPLAYNHAKRLRTLMGLTPHEYVCKCWTSEPTLFNTESVHYAMRPYT